MLTVFCVVLLSFPIESLSQSWHEKACLEGRSGYVEKLAQETMYKLEKDVKFCNLRVDGFNQTINNQMYSWRVSGKVHYSDIFLISMGYANIEKISSMVTRRLRGDVAEYQAGIHFTLVFHSAKIGFNALVQLDNEPEQRFTSDFVYNLISFPISITRNLNINTTEYTVTGAGSQARHNRMNFIPTTNVTQVLGRNFQSHQISGSFTKWGREIIVPIMKELGEKTIPFPTIRLDTCN